MSMPGQGGEVDLDQLAREFRLYSDIDGLLEGAYQRQAGSVPGLSELANVLASEYTNIIVDGYSADSPELEQQRDLVRKGFLGFIAVTAQPVTEQDGYDSDGFDIPAPTTFFEVFRHMMDHFKGDASTVAHEWSLMPLLGKVIAGKEEDYLFTDPDARMASIFMTVAGRGFSRRILGLDS